jgi:hypothetical protein
MIKPIQNFCQALMNPSNPTRPAAYITTVLVALVKFDATNRLFNGPVGAWKGLNGSK